MWSETDNFGCSGWFARAIFTFAAGAENSICGTVSYLVRLRQRVMLPAKNQRRRSTQIESKRSGANRIETGIGTNRKWAVGARSASAFFFSAGASILTSI